MAGRRDRSRRRVGLGLAATALAAGIPLATGPAASAAARTPSCTASMLRLVDAGSEGAAGTVYHLLRWTNVSRTACAMRGYPGVSFTDARGRQLGVPAARTPGVPAPRVVLAPGRSAHAMLGVPNTGVFPPASCRPRTSAFLRVYPPGSFTFRAIGFRASVCTTVAGRTHVQAVVPGPGTP